jgi:hypothetical protein
LLIARWERRSVCRRLVRKDGSEAVGCWWWWESVQNQESFIAKTSPLVFEGWKTEAWDETMNKETRNGVRMDEWQTRDTNLAAGGVSCVLLVEGDDWGKDEWHLELD